MSVPPYLFANAGRFAAPYKYTIPGSLEVQPQTATATFDGSAASGNFVPALTFYSQAGNVIARLPLTSTTLTPGQSAEVTWAPFLRAVGGGTSSGLDFQHNGTDVATEKAGDWIDSATITYTVVDDAANGRVKITPSVLITGLASFGCFGDGSDGTLHYDGTSTVLGVPPVAGVYQLTRDIFPQTMTVDSGVVVQPCGWRVFCNGTLTVNGSINQNGKNGNNATSGGGGLAANGWSSLNGVTGFYLGASANGGNGATSAGSGGNGSNGAAESSAWGGSGGAGGTVGAHTGGTAGTATAPSGAGFNINSGRYYWQAATGLFRLQNISFQNINGGAGGGGGCADTAIHNNGGGGAAGGGVVFVASRIVTGTGTIAADGGTGGNGFGTGGGGGGGGAGLVWQFYLTSTITATANGGIAGSGGTSANGANGNAFNIPLT